jgi:hypothetical protein
MSPQLRNRRCTRAMNTVWWLLGSADWLANSASKSSPIQPPSSDSVFMERFKPLKRLDLILSLSKDEDTFSGFFSSLLGVLFKAGQPCLVKSLAIISLQPPGEKTYAKFTQILDRPAFNRKRLKAEKLIDSKVLEQLIRVQEDAGCSSFSRNRHRVFSIKREASEWTCIRIWKRP